MCAQAYIQRDINCLTNSDRATRRTAVHRLKARLLDESFDGTPAPTPGVLQALLGGPLLTPLLQLMGDSVEAVREAAAALLAGAMGRVPDAPALVPAVAPALAMRLSGSPGAPAEPSEEVRLALARMAAGPVLAHGGEALGPATRDLSAALRHALADPCPDIIKAGCSGVAALAAQLPGEALAAVSGDLARALAVDLAHAHSRVRLAALQALDTLVLQGICVAVLRETVAPAVRALADDRAPAVREAAFATAAGWIRRHGGMEWRTALLPTALLALTDSVPPVAGRGVALVSGLADDLPDASDGAMEAVEDAEDDALAAGAYAAAAAAGQARHVVFLQPFQARPAAAVRVLVRQALPEVLPPVLADLRGWTPALRAAAARQLRAHVVLAEAAAAPHLPQLLPALAAAAGDEDAEVAQHVVATAQALGALVPVRHWLPLAAQAAGARAAAPERRACALVALSALLYGAGVAQQAADGQAAALVAAAVADEEALACDHPAVQRQILAVVTNAVALAGPRCEGSSRELWRALLALQARGGAVPEPGSVAEGAHAAAGALAAALGLATPEALAAAHAAPLLDELAQGAHGWEAGAPGQLALAALLRACGPDTLRTLLPDALQVLHGCIADFDRDPALRLTALEAAGELACRPDAPAALAGGGAAALARAALLPPLAWRAGKAAAAVRFAALAALAALLRRRLLDQADLASLAADAALLPLLCQMLDEDFYPESRAAAAAAAADLLAILGGGAGGGRDSHASAAAAALLVHAEDPSPAVAAAARQAASAFAAAAPHAGQ
ncbi:hypothetical protein WJX81_006290 [Elliptochloris bilobata]|uniref:Uncharacterized protein n=1 Tax=Elliptochloris bilobata TaxID=381761 RepID=A0AAW1QV86_9CHLO